MSDWARRAGLTVGATDPATRRVKLRGTVAQMAAAFRVEFERLATTPPGGTPVTYRHHRGPASIPADAGGDRRARRRPQRPPGGTCPLLDRRPRERPGDLHPGAAGGRLPVSSRPRRGSRAHPRHRDRRARRAGRPGGGGLVHQEPTRGVQVIEDAVDGPLPQPDPGGADVEVALDWQMIARALLVAAPQATIRLVLRYGPNTEQGFADVWNSFASDPTYTFTGVSTSWGEAESQWTQGGATAMDAAAQACLAVGIFHITASGDNGASDGSTDSKVYADCPASSPNVLGAGGTKLVASGTAISSEVVWNEATLGEGAGGGGVSQYFPVPTYQSANGIGETSLSTGKTGRSEPDMAADADPVTGCEVVTGLDSSGNPTTTTVGGTSAVAPLLTAGFTAVSAVVGGRLGRLQDPVYAMAHGGKGFRDVTQGNNAYPSGTEGYSAGPGFDVPSGWGSPIFSELASGFSSTAPTPASAGTEAMLTGTRQETAPGVGRRGGGARARLTPGFGPPPCARMAVRAGDPGDLGARP